MPNTTMVETLKIPRHVYGNEIHDGVITFQTMKSHGLDNDEIIKRFVILFETEPYTKLCREIKHLKARYRQEWYSSNLISEVASVLLSACLIAKKNKKTCR
jgi:hypothetical protein